MKILESDISFLSSHYKHSQVDIKESLQQWSRPEDAPQRLQSIDRLELSEKFQSMYKDKEIDEIADEFSEASLDPKLLSIIRALEALTGKKVNLSFYKHFKALEFKANQETVESQQSQRAGWGLDYHYEKTEIKTQALNFSAQGSVKTEDGKSIDFSLALSMIDQSQTHESISIKAGDALIDPLVLNFGSNIVEISDVKHSFDLDLDGKSDNFSFVGEGSGFLALDKNKDGIINDGSELFGPTLGNGFNELAAYDSDSNNWIDENDDVFDKLLIWTKDDSGEENLYSLKEKDIGALYLGSSQTPFELISSDGTTQAQMKESGVYLKESGEVGTLQEIDLVV